MTDVRASDVTRSPWADKIDGWADMTVEQRACAVQHAWQRQAERRDRSAEYNLSVRTLNSLYRMRVPLDAQPEDAAQIWPFLVEAVMRQSVVLGGAVVSSRGWGRASLDDVRGWLRRCGVTPEYGKPQ